MTDKEFDAIYYAKRNKWFWLEIKINTLHDLKTESGKERRMMVIEEMMREYLKLVDEYKAALRARIEEKKSSANAASLPA